MNIGTPPQAQFVQLDTGSFELWVNPQCDNLPLGDSAFCESVGFFDTSQSSSFSSLGTSKQLRYGIGTANITYVRDDITLPGSNQVLRQIQFGVATSTEREFSGILGIGYGQGLTTRYPNFLDELHQQNVTKVKAFTVALGAKTEQEGVIVFGGVDTSKFSGRLARLPITPAAQSPDGVPRYWVGMQSISLTPPSGRRKTYDNTSMQVFLDSGSTLTLLPEAIVSAVAADFNAVGPDNNGFFSVDCGLARLNGSLDFAFQGVTIRVPYGELIRTSGDNCVLGMAPNAQFVLLGDTFMRSAYSESSSFPPSQPFGSGRMPGICIIPPSAATGMRPTGSQRMTSRSGLRVDLCISSTALPHLCPSSPLTERAVSALWKRKTDLGAQPSLTWRPTTSSCRST